MLPDRLRHRIDVANDPIRIVQITDCHLEREFGGALLGMDTDNSLSYVLSLVRKAQDADVYLATGDLANHGSEAAYLRFKDYTEDLPGPIFWCAGNHDDLSVMESVVNAGQPLVRSIEIGSWQILLLDSTVPGEVGGTLGEPELELLSHALQEESFDNTLVCLHHHPVPIGCAWLDQQRVADADALFEVLDNSTRVRGLLCGHVHQEHDIVRGNLTIMSSPSSCVQFLPHSDVFSVDEQAPGYRWLLLHRDGRIETGVERIAGVELDFDRNSSGYV